MNYQITTVKPEAKFEPLVVTIELSTVAEAQEFQGRMQLFLPQLKSQLGTPALEGSELEYEQSSRMNGITALRKELKKVLKSFSLDFSNF